MSKPTFGDGTVTTNAPDGVVCGTINQFVLLSLQSDELTLRWCAIGDPTDWPTPATDDARSKQAGQQKFNGKYGLITGIAGNDFFGYIFQQRAITKATYVGGDIVFTFDTFEEGRGCFEYERFVQIDDVVVFESEFGRHALIDGQIQDIGHGFTDDTYRPEATLEQKTVAVNTGIQTIFFEDGDLAFNYKTSQWTHVDGLSASHFYSIDSADGVIGQVVFDDVAVDLQDSSGGAVLEATLETGEKDLNEGGRTLVNGVRPLFNGASASVRVGVRDDLEESVTYSTGTSLNSRTGMSHFRGAANSAEGRYQRVEIKSSDFETLMGVDVEFTPAGRV